MKLAQRAVFSFFAQKRWQEYSLLLFFGHAEEIMRGYTESILQNAKIDRDDAFAFLRLYGAEINQDPHLLLHEATSSSLTQQERWIIAQGKTSELEASSKELLVPEMQQRLGENRLVLIFQDLTTTSPLLKKAAELDWVAAIPCYEASQEMLFDEIRQFCQWHNVRANQEAENTLLECAEGKLAELQHLLEKVALFGIKGTLEREIILACHGNDQQLGIQEFIFAVYSAQADTSDQLLRGLLEQKIVPVTLIRALAQHCMKLLRLQSLAQHSSIERAMEQHQPPIFFKQKRQIQQQCQRWTTPKLQEVLKQLLEQEIQAKSHKFYDTVMLRQHILRIAKSV